MKVLWCISVVIKEAGEAFGLKSEATVPWMDHVSSLLRKQESLTICFPCSEVTELTKKTAGDVCFVAIPAAPNPYEYTQGYSELYKKVFDRIHPDVIHIWGTEYPYTLSALEAAKDRSLLDSTVVSIQGLISRISDAFMADLPEEIQHSYSFKDFVKRRNLITYRDRESRRGEYEEKALNIAKHVMGRTEWDRRNLLTINPKLQYHYCSETLRKCFYGEEVRGLDGGVSHRLFMAQGGLPYKGFHYMLEAMKHLVHDYPDLTLHITGPDLHKGKGIKNRLRMSAYELYVQDLMYRYGLEKHIEFVGALSGPEMKEEYLEANVFVLPSAIENSPNALGEAMLLGIPCVAANVGGVTSICTPDEEGLVYPAGDVYELETAIRLVLEAYDEKDDPDGGDEICAEWNTRLAAAKAHAEKLYDPQSNLNCLLDIYRLIERK